MLQHQFCLQCALVYETLNDAIQEVTQAGRGAVMMKRDLKTAFAMCPSALVIYWLLVFDWNGRFFVDMFLPLVYAQLLASSTYLHKHYIGFLKLCTNRISHTTSMIFCSCFLQIQTSLQSPFSSMMSLRSLV